MNNIFLNDPLLGAQNDYAQKIAELKQMQEDLERSRRTIQQPAKAAPSSSSPIWDEINRIVSDMPEREYEILSEDEDFKTSEQHLMALIQQEYMKVMRPIVEGTQEGRDALESHLRLIKSIRKKASREAGKELDQFKEYTEKYSHMTFKEYKEMKGQKE